MLKSRQPFALLMAVIAAGAVLRALPVLADTFPVNDGGMFAVMVDEVRGNAFALGPSTAYNNAGIPFAYPPLAFYVAAVAGAMGPSTMEVMRFAPLLFSVATIPIMYLISRHLLGGKGLTIGATAFFAFSTGSYQWLVMGGGLTRSLGFFMALLAVYYAIRMYKEGGAWSAVACGAALGATALSHPQAAIFGALSVPLLLPFVAADRSRATRQLAVTIVVAVAVVVPWLTAVLVQHGFAPLLSAVGTGGAALLGVVSLASSRTSGGYLEVIGILTSLGVVMCCVRRFWLPPVWILAIAIADSRAGQPYLSVPAALAIAFLLGDVGRVALRSMAARSFQGWPRHLPAALAVVVVGAAFLDSLASQSVPGSPLRTLSAETRGAMAWVRSETDPTARFVVVSGRYWALDAEAEWFPALAQRRSLSTVQGSEWQGRYAEQVERASELPRCVIERDRGCIERWFAAAGEVNYLFLVDTPSREIGGVVCCHQLVKQVSDLYDTEVVHREGAVLVVRLTPRSS